MKSKVFSVLLIAAALSLTGCKDDALIDDNQPNSTESSGKKLYISAAVALPSTAGSRSSTEDGPFYGDEDDEDDDLDPNNQTNSDIDKESKEDFEYGYDYENDVRTMILVIADKDNKYITHTIVSGIEKAPTGTPNFDFDVTAEIKYEDMEKAYKGEGGNEAPIKAGQTTVHIFAFCNYTARLEQLFKYGESGTSSGEPASGNPGEGDYDNWLDWAGEVVEASSPAGHTPVLSNTIWANRSFLMTNYSIAEATFPDELEKWDDYADKNNPYKINADGKQDKPLTPIKVERAAARIDFRDASIGKDQIYPIKTDVYSYDSDNKTTTKTGTKNLFSVQLTRMSLVNMSKHFYYLRRVSTDGLNDGATYGGAETSTNYVVDTDAEVKEKTDGDETGMTTSGITPGNVADQHFNFCLYDEDGNYAMEQWYVDNISDVLKGSNDTWSGSVNNRYNIWRYVTENTIPTIDMQKTIQSVGVVFKGSIIAGENIKDKYTSADGTSTEDFYVSEKVREALDNAKEHTVKYGEEEHESTADTAYDYPTLYSFDGFLYAGWEELIKEAGKQGYGSTLYSAIENILKDDLKLKLDADGKKYIIGGTGEALDMDIAYKIVTNEEIKPEGSQDPQEEPTYKYPDVVGLSIEITDEDVVTHAPDYNITVYEVSYEENSDPKLSGWGYYCYYFYWNRHNDNLKSGKMGQMEFATVRNNVYKLAVTEINKFGHPRNKDHDPDPVDPNDPDEEPLFYMQVQVEVLPWVVRVNDITF